MKRVCHLPLSLLLMTISTLHASNSATIYFYFDGSVHLKQVKYSIPVRQYFDAQNDNKTALQTTYNEARTDEQTANTACITAAVDAAAVLACATSDPIRPAKTFITDTLDARIGAIHETDSGLKKRSPMNKDLRNKSIVFPGVVQLKKEGDAYALMTTADDGVTLREVDPNGGDAILAENIAVWYGPTDRLVKKADGDDIDLENGDDTSNALNNRMSYIPAHNYDADDQATNPDGANLRIEVTDDKKMKELEKHRNLLANANKGSTLRMLFMDYSSPQIPNDTNAGTVEGSVINTSVNTQRNLYDLRSSDDEHWNLGGQGQKFHLMREHSTSPGDKPALFNYNEVAPYLWSEGKAESYFGFREKWKRNTNTTDANSPPDGLPAGLQSWWIGSQFELKRRASDVFLPGVMLFPINPRDPDCTNTRDMSATEINKCFNNERQINYLLLEGTDDSPAVNFFEELSQNSDTDYGQQDFEDLRYLEASVSLGASLKMNMFIFDMNLAVGSPLNTPEQYAQFLSIDPGVNASGSIGGGIDTEYGRVMVHFVAQVERFSANLKQKTVSHKDTNVGDCPKCPNDHGITDTLTPTTTEIIQMIEFSAEIPLSNGYTLGAGMLSSNSDLTRIINRLDEEIATDQVKSNLETEAYETPTSIQSFYISFKGRI